MASKVKQNTYELAKIEHLNENYFVLEIIDEDLAKQTKPGQFFEIKADNQLLRIPISTYEVEQNTIKLMIKILGEGTRSLSHLQRGDSLDVLGPLGNEFSLPQNKNVLLISGGVGYPPLFYLKKKLTDCNVVWFHGGQNKLDIFPADETYTDDGSIGKKGFVTKDLEYYLENHQVDIIFTCGPKIMMKKIVEIASKFDVPVEVSLEEYMACGLGACYGCVVSIKENQGMIYKRVCKDGPIFDGYKVVWDE